jgi:cyanophycin synthetase
LFSEKTIIIQMQIIDSHYCYGPNIYTDKPAFWCILDLDKLAGYQTNKLGPNFCDALLGFLPGLQFHDLEDGQSFPVLLKNGEGIHVGRVVERIAIELQRLAGHNVSWSTTIFMDTPTTCKVVVECHDKVIYPMVLKLSLFVLNNLLPKALRDNVKLPPDFNLKNQLPGSLSSLRGRGLDLSTKAIVQKAIERGIPWQRLHPNFPFVQLGHGCFARRVFETSSSADNPIRLSSNKNVTGQLLTQIGLPVPKQAIVVTARQAVAAAHAIGYPVVVKPNQGKKGLGVTTGIVTDTGVTRAAEKAIKYGGVVVVEQHIEGEDHRLLIVDGKFVAAAKRIPAHVVGDGTHSIKELVEKINRDPRRGIGFEKHLVKLKLDKSAVSLLKKAGFTPKSIPGKDEIVYLSDIANISAGGTAVDVTEQVHPDNRCIAETAVIQFGLAVSGVDFITPDISCSWREVPGCIIEVNNCPGLRPHWIADPDRDVVGPILDILFPENSPSQIPIAAITGSNGKTTTSQMLAHILKLSGLKCGLATTQGVFIDGQQILHGDFAGGTGAQYISPATGGSGNY